MINFIIYEDSEVVIKRYESIIHKFMGRSDCKYRTCPIIQYSSKFSNFIKNSDGHNIYILDLEVPGKSGIDVAREIRKNGKQFDQIIMITAHNELKENAYKSKTLMVDFLSKYDNIEENLTLCLRHAFEFIEKDKTLVIKQEGEILQIPYTDILCIEKLDNELNPTIITDHEKIPINRNLTEIEKILKKDPRFFRCHRSCIVNTFNITKVDMPNQVIMLGKHRTTNLSRNNKKELERRLCIDQI